MKVFNIKCVLGDLRAFRSGVTHWTRPGSSGSSPWNCLSEPFWTFIQSLWVFTRSAESLYALTSLSSFLLSASLVTVVQTSWKVWQHTVEQALLWLHARARVCVCVCALAPSIDRLMSLTIEWQFSSLTAFLVCFCNLTLGTGMDIRGVLTKAFLVYSKRLISIWSLQGCAMYLIALIVTPSIGLDTIKHGAN